MPLAVKEWLVPKITAIKSDHKSITTHERKGVGITRVMIREFLESSDAAGGRKGTLLRDAIGTTEVKTKKMCP